MKFRNFFQNCSKTTQGFCNRLATQPQKTSFCKASFLHSSSFCSVVFSQKHVEREIYLYTNKGQLQVCSSIFRCWVKLDDSFPLQSYFTYALFPHCFSSSPSLFHLQNTSWCCTVQLNWNVTNYIQGKQNLISYITYV